MQTELVDLLVCNDAARQQLLVEGTRECSAVTDATEAAIASALAFKDAAIARVHAAVAARIAVLEADADAIVAALDPIKAIARGVRAAVTTLAPPNLVSVYAPLLAQARAAMAVASSLSASRFSPSPRVRVDVSVLETATEALRASVASGVVVNVETPQQVSLNRARVVGIGHACV
jgi:hypothetical protein